ncbi:MAG: ABC transporter substrate-binding protein [Hyphomicrobium sp.]
MMACSALRRGRLTALWLLAVACATPCGAAEKLSFGVHWLPEAEHCGFYQASAKGLYAAKGLDVEIVPGGPDVNMSLQLATGRVDVALSSALAQLKMTAQKIPAITVAAYFQKDPQTIVAHPDPMVKDISDLKGRPMLIGTYSREEFWQWLKAKYGFTDDQLRPYTYNPAPFLADKLAVEQGYVTNDGFLLTEPLGAEPKIFLLADNGYLNYQNTIQVLKTTFDKKPSVIKAFLEASSEGWKQCLAGDFGAAEDAVLNANKDQTKGLFEYSMKEIINRKIAAGEEGLPLGTMTNERWKTFTDAMVGVGVLPKEVDYSSAFTLKLF